MLQDDFCNVALFFTLPQVNLSQVTIQVVTFTM